MEERQQGRGDELEAWVLATWTRAVAYAASLLKDRAAAEDAVHDCYCSLLQKASVYDLPRDGMKLLLKSVTNACIKRNTRGRPVVSLSLLQAGGDGAPVLEDRSAQEPPRQLMARELERAIEAGLERLPLPQRAALELKSLGQSHEEIAAALAVTATHAGVLVHRARQAMARYLSAHLEEAG